MTDLSLLVKFAGLDRGIVIKGKPAVQVAIVAEILFFELYHFQGKVIIGHNPEGIGVDVGGEEIA